MADMAGALMRGYGFVNDIQQQKKNNERQDYLQARQGILDQRADEEYEKKKSEDAGLREGIQGLIKSMAAKDPAWKQVADNPAATEKMGTLAEDPLSAAKAVNQWYQVKDHLDSGKLPNSQLTLDFLNNPNVAGRDLSRRFAANKLEGALSAVYPSPDRKGLFFEATLTGPDGKQYVAPLTKGRTRAGVPGSEQDEVESYPMSKLLDFGQGAAEGNMGALMLIAEKGGTAGAQFAAKFLMEKDNARREMLIKEYEYQREKGDKDATRKEDRQWSKEDADTKHRYAMAEKTPPGYDLVKGEDGEIYTMNKATGDVKPYGGAPAAGGLKGYVTTGGGQVFKNKEAKELFKSLPGVFLAKASAGDALMTLFNQSGDNPDSMPMETKKSIVAAAEEVAANPNATERERSMAKLWLDIGEGLKVFPKAQAGAVQPPPADGQQLPPKRRALAEFDKTQGGTAGPAAGIQTAPAHAAVAPPAPPAKGGIARAVGRTLAGPGGPQSDSMGLRTVAQGLSAGAALATPAMVQTIQGIPESVKQTLLARMAVEKWTVEQLAQAVKDVQAGYQEQNAINQQGR